MRRFAEVFKSKLVRVSAWTFSSKQPAAASSTLLIPLLAQTFTNWLKHSSSDETKPGDVWFNSDHVSGPAEWWETAEGRNQDAASDQSYVLCTCGCDHIERNVTHHHLFLLLAFNAKYGSHESPPTEPPSITELVLVADSMLKQRNISSSRTSSNTNE